MNLFLLDPNSYVAATCLSDSHVRKMILETAQILDGGTRAILNDLYPGKDHAIVPIPWTQRDNPVILSARDQMVYFWALAHLDSLVEEFNNRFGGVHSYKKQGVLHRLRDRGHMLQQGKHFPSARGFRLAMPDRFKGYSPDYVDSVFDAVLPYRAYYAAQKLWDRKGTPLTWTKRQPPAWIAKEAMKGKLIRVMKDDKCWFEVA